MRAELRLLLVSARRFPTEKDGDAIRRLLIDGVDWTRFAREVVEQGLAGVVGQTLDRLVPEMVPDELRDAFRANFDRTRQSNRILLTELAGILEALMRAGVAALTLPNPVLAAASDGELGLCTLDNLDLLVPDDQLAASLATLRSLGYEREQQLTDAQLNLMHRIRGHELLVKKALGAGVTLRTRLAPIHMALDIDHSSLWRRTTRVTLNGRAITAPAPEDALLVLAVLGGVELWRRPRLACEFACFIQSHPNLDWAELLVRARRQGCHRMVVLATALARGYFGAALPDTVAAGTPALDAMAKRIKARWLGGQPAAAPETVSFCRERQWLHDETMRRVRHIGRSLLLPRPLHVSQVPLPASLTLLPAYVPIKLAHDIALRPLATGWRSLRAHAERLDPRLTDQELPGRRVDPLQRENGRAAHEETAVLEHPPTQVRFRNEAADKPMVMFNWRPSSYFGWGVYGLNLMLHWARRSDLALCCARPINNDNLVLNPLERLVIDPVLRRSRDACDRLSEASGRAEVSCLVLNALGNNLGGSAQLSLHGNPTIGIVFFENSVFDATVHERARRYPLIVAGSTWNRDVLRELGMDHVQTVIQGVDTTNFHPAPRAGLFEDRFVVFSGGKVERRKGQDLVAQAFRVFAQRHPDALLVTAWTSPWPQLARSLEQNSSISPIPFRSDGQIDVVGWLRANGIPERQVLDLGRVPNAGMPRILRECDVALFPNRAEGGTNLVAMECMACGVPTILSANTGHLDLIRAGNCYALDTQTPITDPKCQGWGESSIDEIVETLEIAYCDRSEAQRRGCSGAETLAELSWGRQLDKLAELIRPYLS